MRRLRNRLDCLFVLRKGDWNPVHPFVDPPMDYDNRVFLALYSSNMTKVYWYEGFTILDTESIEESIIDLNITVGEVRMFRMMSGSFPSFIDFDSMDFAGFPKTPLGQKLEAIGG